MTDTTTRTDDFTAVLHLDATPAAVATLFTSAEGVSRWWGPAEGDGAVGGMLLTSFGEHGFNAVRVLEAGPDRVVWESIAPDGVTVTAHTPEWLGTTMVFDIVPAGTGTELRFRHTGLTPQLACWDDCFAGWTYFMTSIETLVETGTGTPYGA
ncbi:SRPBCC domain-containing protein [Acidothermaceae bacterium B102]|nr:SRPBCC domain-containing protein [Acidothermaceae bacterium B102]